MTGTHPRYLLTAVVCALVVCLMTLPVIHLFGPGSDSDDIEEIPRGEQDTTRSFGMEPSVTISLDMDASFIMNAGQLTDGSIKYYTQGRDMWMAFTEGSVRYHVIGEADGHLTTMDTIELIFDGANLVRPEGSDPLPHRSNFISGVEPDDCFPDVRSYREVLYHNLWNGIDMLFYIDGPVLKYDLIISPGADPRSVVLRYEGTTGIRIDPGTGDLLIDTPASTIRDIAPYAYQPVIGGTTDVECRYHIDAGSRVSFDLGGFDSDRPLVIDPGIEYSSYFGGESNDRCIALAKDKLGNKYIMGEGSHEDHPTRGNASFLKYYYSGIWVMKWNPDMTKPIFTTFFGRGINLDATDLAVDGDGYVYLTGMTDHYLFPKTSNAYDDTFNGVEDAYLIKLDKDGSQILYGSFLGGTDFDKATSIEVDEQGRPYIGGYSKSRYFPSAVGSYGSYNNGKYDAFVVRFSKSLDRLEYGNQIGGSNYDYLYGLTVDSNGSAYITGYTSSSDYPITPGAYDSTLVNTVDVFVTKLDANGSSLEYSTFVGRSSTNRGTDIHIDDQGNAYVTGTSYRGMPTTTNAIDNSFNGQTDAFFFSLNADGSDLTYSTYLGGSKGDDGMSVWVNDGYAYVVGETRSPNFPTTENAYMLSFDWIVDLFLTEINLTDGSMTYSTFIGGWQADECTSTGKAVMAVGSREVLVVANTMSWDHPVTDDAYDRSYNDNYDLLFIRIRTSDIPPTWEPVPTLEAVEDIPVSYNFSEYVNDVDTDPDRIKLYVTSPYVVTQDGFDVTFEFPESVLSPSIDLNVSDGITNVSTSVMFDVQPVNDPPWLTLPVDQHAQEDVPKTVDVGFYAWDVDNSSEDMFILAEDRYVTVDGLNLTATFPEGVLRYTLWSILSDGLNEVRFRLDFTIAPVEDPPVIEPLDVIDVIEGVPTPFDIEPYIFDVDTSSDELGIIVRDPNCTVSGMELVFLVEEGGIEYPLEIEVADSRHRITVSAIIRVLEVNDAPIFGAVPTVRTIEDQNKTIDISPFVADEDTLVEDLTIICEHEAVVAIEGLRITFLFTMPTSPTMVDLWVSDGIALTPGTINVTVMENNDLPSIIALGGGRPPFHVRIFEESEIWLELSVVDEDDSQFTYTVDPEWSRIEVHSNGSIHLSPVHGDAGVFLMTLRVEDSMGGWDETELTVSVRFLNRPPHDPTILSPKDGDEYDEGDNVTLEGIFGDPDLDGGDSLNVIWVSNISGLIVSLTYLDDRIYVTDALPVGYHLLTVTILDGEFVRTDTVHLSILAKTEPVEPDPEPEPEPQPTAQDEGIGPALIGIIIALVVLAIILVVLGLRTGGGPGGPDPLETVPSVDAGAIPPPNNGGDGAIIEEGMGGTFQQRNP